MNPYAKRLRFCPTSYYCLTCLRAGVDRGRGWPWLIIMLILKLGVWPEMSWWVTLWPVYGFVAAVLVLFAMSEGLHPELCAFCGELK